MQVSDTKELPKKSRYYQSMLDLQLIDKGQFYDELKRSYVIFICPFDSYGKGRHIYAYENICKEDKSISMGDEAVKIFLNAKGTFYIKHLPNEKRNLNLSAEDFWKAAKI